MPPASDWRFGSGRTNVLVKRLDVFAMPLGPLPIVIESAVNLLCHSVPIAHKKRAGFPTLSLLAETALQYRNPKPDQQVQRTVGGEDADENVHAVRDVAVKGTHCA
jgi:hypothetical protein